MSWRCRCDFDECWFVEGKETKGDGNGMSSERYDARGGRWICSENVLILFQVAECTCTGFPTWMSSMQAFSGWESMGVHVSKMPEAACFSEYRIKHTTTRMDVKQNTLNVNDVGYLRIKKH